MSGATPRGAANEQEAAAWVRDMFGRVAPRYDLLNHLLSFNIDRHWRARTVQRLQPVLDRQDATVIDLCCGTGDLMLALRAKAKARVLGSDFCHPMLTAAKQKAGVGSPFFEADALKLPIGDRAVDAITVAFGFRNLANYEAGLARVTTCIEAGRNRGDSRVLAAAESGFQCTLRLLFEEHPAAHRRADLGGFRCVHLPARFRAKVPRRSWASGEDVGRGVPERAVRENDLRHRRAAYGCPSRELRNQLEV